MSSEITSTIRGFEPRPTVVERLSRLTKLRYRGDSMSCEQIPVTGNTVVVPQKWPTPYPPPPISLQGWSWYWDYGFRDVTEIFGRSSSLLYLACIAMTSLRKRNARRPTSLLDFPIPSMFVVSAKSNPAEKWSPARKGQPRKRMVRLGRAGLSCTCPRYHKYFNTVG